MFHLFIDKDFESFLVFDEVLIPQLWLPTRCAAFFIHPNIFFLDYIRLYLETFIQDLKLSKAHAFHRWFNIAKFIPQILMMYLSSVPPTEQVWHKTFLRWFLAQGRNPHTSSISKNPSDPVGIPRKGAPQGPGDKLNLGEWPPDARGISSDKTQSTWTAHRITAGRMCPIKWICHFSKDREAILMMVH